MLEDVDRLALALEQERHTRLRAELAHTETRRDMLVRAIREKYDLEASDVVNLETGAIARRENGAHGDTLEPVWSDVSDEQGVVS